MLNIAIFLCYTMGTMSAAKSIKSLIWSDATYSFSEFLDKFGVPNLVRVSEGHYGVNEACTFENDQILMLHALRRKINVTGEDTDGKPIAIPLQCENRLLRCPLPIQWRHDTINVSQIPWVYPDIKYFRVLENNWDQGLYYLEPESILEVENVDSINSTVKFKDIDQPLPSNCRVVFEPLLDYSEYTLKHVVSLSGLPAKVRFLRSPSSNQNVENDFENLVSNLGKVTLIHSAEPQTVVVATMMGADSSHLANTSIRCSQIPKDYSVKVSVAKGLLKKNPAYRNIVRELNQTFLDTYDLNELDNLEKCQYLNQPIGERVLGSVLVAKVNEQNNNVPKLLPRTQRDVKVPPPVPTKPLKQTLKQDLVTQFQTRKDADEKRTIRQYDDVKPHLQVCTEGAHLYESVCDSSSSSDYEEIDDSITEDRVMSRDRVTTTTHEYVDMLRKVHTTSQSCANVTSDDHESKTSNEDEYYTICNSLRSDYENSALMLEQRSKMKTELARCLKVSFPRLRPKPEGESTSEILKVEANNKKSDKLLISRISHQTTQNVSIPTELTLKPGGNKSSENINLEPAIKKSPNPSKQKRATVVTCKPAVPLPINECVLPNCKATFAGPIPKDLSSLTVEGVGRLLASLNMACYAEKFEKEQVDGEILMELDEIALKSLNLMPFHVRKLLKVIAGWRPNVDSNNL